ncbi:hypothetical protein Leryth_016006 [Lithospermum erythrorhizon]|nr:hypothetical protein Leryth_016006 [Lithospermum erythrorhizon]
MQLLQIVQRNGPSHGFEAGEKKGPELMDNPSVDGTSTWQTAHLKSPPFELSGTSLPNLQADYYVMESIESQPLNRSTKAYNMNKTNENTYEQKIHSTLFSAAFNI